MEHGTTFHLPLSNPVTIFTLVLFIMLVIPLALKKLRVPGIVGLIISGVIVGPHGFNLIEKNSAIDLLSTIGLLYIMFLAGLELDLNEFAKRRNRSIVFGSLTFFIPILIGLPVCYYVLGYGFTTSFLTSIMFATHTLIAYPIVSRMGLTGNEAVAITVGGTILTDTAVLILLSITTSVSGSGLDWLPFLKTILAIAIFMVFILFVVPRLSKWFFSSHQGDQGAHFIYVLFVVFFLALLASQSGVEPIIGAFAAGLVLNPFIPHNSTLMNRVSFSGNVLFIPFFLISVGMLVDPHILVKDFKAIEVALILTTVAFSGKWIAAYFTQKIFGYSRNQRNMIFGLSSAHAAATLAIILVGYNVGILNVDILNGTVVLILITSLVATLVTEKSATKVALEDKVNELPERKGHEKIIVPVANPENIEHLIDLAVLLKNKKSIIPITVLTVVKDDEESQSRIVINHKKLKPAIDYAASMGTHLEITTAIDVNAASGIIRLSRETLANTMVLGWKGKAKLTEQLFGHFYDRIINSFSGQIAIAKFTHPINLHTSMMVLIPEHMNKEADFVPTLSKIMLVSKGLKLKTTLYGCLSDLDEIENEVQKQKWGWNMHRQVISSPEDFCSRDVPMLESDLVFVVTSREYTPTYCLYIKKMPSHLEERGFNGSLILFYPAQNTSSSLKTVIQ